MHPKIEQAKALIVLNQPFFASLLLRRPIEEAPKEYGIPTIGVTPHGQIYYNAKWIEDKSIPECVFLLCHEVMHYASLHDIRRGFREHMVYNLAGDAWINQTLVDLNVGEPVKGGVNTPGGMIQVPNASQRAVEDIYDELMTQVQQIEKMKAAGGEMGGDMIDTGEADGGLTEAEQNEIEAQVKLEVAEAAQTAKMFGKLPGALGAFAAAVIESRVPWYDILERFMTERVKNDYSWARPNRRYAPDFYLPMLDGVGAMGPIVVQVDISGSVSKEEINHYNGHLKRIVEQCRPSAVHVIYTDTAVQRHDEFTELEDVEIRFYSGGGTDMRAGFQFIEDKGIEPEVFVTLTDGYTPFPASTDVPSIWCISSKEVSPCGETVHFTVE